MPLPWDTDQAIYVWIDALINYTSALTYARPGEDLTARLWPARWQLLGKDILRFHAVIWPAMLLSAGYELPQQLFIHGMLAGQDGHRMSKTRGNAMDYRPAAELYGPDALRYYLLREVGFGQDGGVGYAGMHDRYHGELANELGNLVSRSVAMVDALPRRRHSRGAVGTGAGRAGAPRSRTATSTASSVLDFTGALERVWELVRALNRFVESRAPWELAQQRRSRPRPRRSTRRSRRSARACARSRCCSGRSCPRRPR